MKIFFSKILLYVCACVAIVEAAIFLLVGLARIPPEKVLSLYAFVTQTKEFRNVSLGLAAGFLCVGIVLLIISVRLKGPQKLISTSKDGEDLDIPVDAVKDFIGQILTQNPSMNDFDITIHNKKGKVYIDINVSVGDSVSIQQGIHELRNVLKEEIERVFEFPYLKINFQIKGIRVNPEKKFSRTSFVDVDQNSSAMPAVDQTLNDDAPAEQHKESAPQEDGSHENKTHKKMPWER